jgi:hypothetical protein
MTRRGQYVKAAPKRYKAYLDVVRLYARQAMSKSGFQFIRKGIPIEMGCKDQKAVWTAISATTSKRSRTR